MRHFVVAFIAVLVLAGCKTQTQEVTTIHPWPKEKLATVYADLKTVPIPVPTMTPFDADSRQRDAYLAGFKDGWDFANSR